jgi:hypothetical protein
VEEDNFLQLRLVPDEEFRILSTIEKVEYLKKAIEARKVINRQIEEMLFGIPNNPRS